MPREIPFGTPSRGAHYVRPRPAYRLFFMACALGALAFGFAVLLLVTPEAWGLRTLVAPGRVVSAHAIVESRCQSCHVASGTLSMREASDTRCLRCHGSLSSGTQVHAAHVLFGGGNPGKATAREKGGACVACHVEHRGRGRDLSRLGDSACSGCHFRRFAAHPEFAAVRSRSGEDPGLVFSHERHLRTDVLVGYAKAGLSTAAVGAPEAACVLCHEPDSQSRDLAPLSFDRHCARCHAQELQLGTEALPARLLAAPVRIAQRGSGAVLGLPATVEAARGQEAAEFSFEEGEARKKLAVHKDAWILYNRAALGRALLPQAHEDARARLLAERVRLARRLALAQPLAEMNQRGLRELESDLVASLGALEERRAAQVQAPQATESLATAERIAAAAVRSGDAALRDKGNALQDLIRRARAPERAALSAEELDRARQPLLDVIRGLRQEAPALAQDLDPVTARLSALAPGETSAEALQRVTLQRAADLGAARDELRLIDGGVRTSEAPPRPLTAGRDRPLREALQRATWRLAFLDAPAAVGQKEELTAALHGLWNPCRKCHAETSEPMAPVAAAARTLRRARFAHQPHLRTVNAGGALSCTTCHAGADKSALSSELHVPGIEGCRGCHNDRQVSDACPACHRYHPLERP